jgi:hypothetical protein
VNDQGVNDQGVIDFTNFVVAQGNRKVVGSRNFGSNGSSGEGAVPCAPTGKPGFVGAQRSSPNINLQGAGLAARRCRCGIKKGFAPSEARIRSSLFSDQS